jgi:hypothetical protein
VAVFALWEALAGICKGGAAVMETVGVVVVRLKIRLVVSVELLCRWSSPYLFTVVADPFRNDDGGYC